MKRGREYQGCGEEYNVEKEGKGKQYHITYNIEAVGRISREDFKKWWWGRIS